MKQETLEEAAEKFRSENPGTTQGGNNTKILNAFKNGAKWQQERSYSEQDVHNIISNYAAFIGSGMKIPYIEWFEQFKKK